MKISRHCLTKSENINIIHLWKVVEAFHRPKIILLKV